MQKGELNSKRNNNPKETNATGLHETGKHANRESGQRNTTRKRTGNRRNHPKPKSAESSQFDSQETDSSAKHGGIIHLPRDVDVHQSASVQKPKALNWKPRAECKPVNIVRPQRNVSGSGNFGCEVSNVDERVPQNAHVPFDPTKVMEESSPAMRPTNNPEIGLLTNEILQHSRTLAGLLIPPGHIVSSLPDPHPEELAARTAIDGLLPEDANGEEWAMIHAMFSKWWCAVYRLRTLLLNAYQRIILLDLDYCHATNVEQHLWKSVFYSVVETLRTWIDAPFATGLISPDLSQNRSRSIGESLSKHMLALFVNDLLIPGEVFLCQLLLAIQQTQRVNLGLIFNTARPPPQTKSRNRKLTYICAQKLLLFLGDLTRYRELIEGNQNYGKSRSYYQKAQLLIPKNGTPYNQLAVIALYTNRYFEAMFFYMRTLAASNPFPTATQSLGVFFNQMSICGARVMKESPGGLGRFPATGAGEPDEGYHHQAYRPGSHHLDSRHRRAEIWLHPIDGSVTVVKGNRALHLEARRQRPVSQPSAARSDKQAQSDSDEAESDSDEDARDEANEYADVSLTELSKKFSVFFMDAHGKLFTKIGMETFPEAASLALQCLSGLLVKSPCPLTAERLCQLLLVNMFNVDRAASPTSQLARPLKMKSASTTPRRFDSDTLRSVHHDHASRFALDTFAIICRRASKLLANAMHLGRSSGQVTIPEDLRVFLPALRLWSEWLILHPEHWSPPPNHRDPTLRPCLDDWALVANMCSKAAKFLSVFPSPRPSFEELNPTTALVLRDSCRTFDAERETYPTLLQVNLDASQVTFPVVQDDEAVSSRASATLGPNEAFVTLAEEVCVAGFKPMLDLEPKLYAHSGDLDSRTMEDYIRLEKIVLLGDFLCGIEPPVLNYDLETGVYQSVVEREMSEKPQSNVKSPQKETESLEPLYRPEEKEAEEEEEEEEAEEQEYSGDEEISQLKQQRAVLERKLQEERRLEAWRRFAIREAAADGHVGVEVEVRPIYILPDTNCYIDWLSGVASLAQPQSNYTILVPIIVLNELDHLAHPNRRSNMGGQRACMKLISDSGRLLDGGDSITRSDLIPSRAKAAIAWLEEEFDKRNNRLRALTAKGTILESIGYRTEEIQSRPDLVNDDIILNCCRAYCRDRTPKTDLSSVSDKTGPVRITREVVLLSSDRNLRLKALSLDIPARLLHSFVEWSRLPLVEVASADLPAETNNSSLSTGGRRAKVHGGSRKKTAGSANSQHRHFPSLPSSKNA